MGQCCKCGRETPHAYTYWTGDLIGTKRAVSPKNAKYCLNPQKHTAFLCTRHVLVERVILLTVFSALHAVLFTSITIDRYRLNLRLTIPWSMSDIIGIICYGLLAAFGFGMLLYILHVGRRDKKLPFHVFAEQAEHCIVKVMRKQAPGKSYFAPSDYH